MLLGAPDGGDLEDLRRAEVALLEELQLPVGAESHHLAVGPQLE